MAGLESNGEANGLKPRQSGTQKLFDNPILEKISRTHIAFPISLYLTISAALLTYAMMYTNMATYLIPLLFFSGFLFFTLIEYLMHRYLFHMSTEKPWKKRMQYTMHGVHHDFPKDKDRLAMPPIVSILYAVILFFVFYSLMNTKVFGFLPGVMTGYATYLFVHFIIHAYPPPKNFFKYLWIYHAIHHYKDNTVVFGVSSPLWDYVFGTLPKKKKKV